MRWPEPCDYAQPIQNLRTSFKDPAIRAGSATLKPSGEPKPWTGNFAVVFEVQSANRQKWAVKCFTREVAGLQERYRLIGEYLKKSWLPFMVGFEYVPDGLLLNGRWYPFLKMDWVDGLRLDELIARCFQGEWNPQDTLGQLCEMWINVARLLREAKVAHGDLQHGNVLLVPVPQSATFSLKLIDYDGLCVPSLANRPSGELGHAGYQHPQRSRAGGYGPEIDRFSHLLIYCSLRCLMTGGKELWDRYYDGDNLLFGKADLEAPEKSRLFHELLNLPNPEARDLAGHLLLAAKGPIDAVPLLDEVVADSRVVPLSNAQQQEVDRLLFRVTPRKALPAAPRRRRYWPIAVAAMLLLLLTLGGLALLPLLWRGLSPPVNCLYGIEIEPAGAVLTVSDSAARVAQDGRKWTIAIERPNADAAIDLAVSMPGYQPLHQDLRPVPGESRDLPPLRLQPLPAVYSVELDPPQAMLAVSDAKRASVAHEGSKWTVTVRQSDVKTAIALVAALPGYDAVRQEVQPFPGEKRSLPPLRLRRSPAVYAVEIQPAEAVLQVSDSAAASVARQGPKWIVTVADPDPKTAIVLQAVLRDYKPVRCNLLPSPGETRNLASIQLEPIWPATITNSTGMKFVKLPAGTFLMGSPAGEGDSDERPQHPVRFAEPFYMAACLVTQAQYERVVGNNPSHFKASGGDAPVERVSWDDAQAFCGKLADLPKEKAEGRSYRLPTEAQWEYACRAGSATRYCYGNEEGRLDDYAWYDRNSANKTRPVGRKKANAWGLYDMHGNVWEWCADWYEDNYKGQPRLNQPAGPSAGSSRVLRGGSWNQYASRCRSAYRNHVAPGLRINDYGFRVVLLRTGGT